MALYPSLEDLKVDQMMRAQDQLISSMAQTQPMPNTGYVRPGEALSLSMYPSLGDYMGLELSEELIAANMPEYLQVATTTRTDVVPVAGGMIAPVSGQSVGLQRAHVSGGIRQVSFL